MLPKKRTVLWKEELRKNFPMCFDCKMYPVLQITKMNSFNENVVVGDEIVLRNIECIAVDLVEKNAKNDINKKSYRINANERPYFSIVPTCSYSHKFSGVRELIDTFPSLSEGIFPLKAFKIDGVMVKEYETLRVLTKIVANFKENEQLAVVLLRGQELKYLFLPQDLDITFQQAPLDKQSFHTNELFGQVLRRGYSLPDVARLWATRTKCFYVKMKQQTLTKDSKKDSRKSSASSLKDMIKKVYKPSKRVSLTETEICSYNQFSEYENKQFNFEPVFEATVSLTSKMDVVFVLPDTNFVEVVEKDKKEFLDAKMAQKLSTTSSENSSIFDRSTKISTGQQQSYLKNLQNLALIDRKSDNQFAITVTVGKNTSINGLDLKENDCIALHRLRKVKKFILKSPSEASNEVYLVSSKFGAHFKRIKEDTIYETKDIEFFEEGEQIKLVKINKQSNNEPKLNIDDTFTILRKLEEKSVIVEKIIENDDNTSNNRRFTEVSIERNFLSLKENFGTSLKLQRVFAFPKINFLPDIEKVCKREEEILQETKTDAGSQKKV